MQDELSETIGEQRSLMVVPPNSMLLGLLLVHLSEVLGDVAVVALLGLALKF